MQINLIFARSFWWDRENIFDESTTKFHSYIEKKSADKNWCLYPASNDTDAKQPDYTAYWTFCTINKTIFW